MGYRAFFAGVSLAVLLMPAFSAQAATPNELYVNRVYLDLLARPADSTALSTYVPQLDAATLSRFNVAASITSSDEFLSDEVSDFYQHLLQRAADPTGASTNLNLLKTPGGTFEQVQSILAGSAEYFTLHGSANDAFISALYSDFLNRPVDNIGLQAGETFLQQGGTRSDLAASILGSSEYRSDLVSGYYLELLHRPADTNGLTAIGYASNVDTEVIPSAGGHKISKTSLDTFNQSGQPTPMTFDVAVIC